VNFFTNWFKKNQDSNKKFKHEEQSLETLLSVDDNGCCKTEKAEAPKPKPTPKVAPAKKPVAKKPAPKKPKAD
jgi:hypothetical protein